MSWLSRVFASEAAPASRDPLDDRWFEPLARRTAANVSVTPRTALSAPVVYDCLTVLSQSVASLPWGVFERLPAGDRRPAPNHPVAALFNDPDGESTPHEFFAQMVWDLAGEGNAVYLQESGRLGPVARLSRVEPSRVTVERLRDGSRRWQVQGDDGQARRHVEGEVWHLRDAPLIEGLVGMSRIHAGREAIGALLALQDYGASYFANDATPPVMIKHPGHFADAASKTNFLRAASAWFGNKRRGPAVLEYGMDAIKLGNTAEEAQFLETRKELQVEISRMWRMPPHKVGIMDKATFSNIEHQALEFVSDTLGPWLSLIESAINRHLMTAPERFYFEFNVAGLLRGDIAARYAAYAVARQWGWLSVNEIRRLENRNAVGRQGDQYLQPMNMTPAGTTPAPTQAAILGPRGEVVSRRIGGEWVGGSDAA